MAIKKKEIKGDALNKTIDLIDKMYANLDQYEKENIQKPLEDLEELRAEQEYLKVNGNKIDVHTGYDTYLRNQERIKVLPNLIIDTQRAINTAREQKETIENDLAISVYKEIKEDLYAEFEHNMTQYKNDLFDGLLKVAQTCNDMNTLSQEYNEAIEPIKWKKGVYLTIDSTGTIDEIAQVFDISKFGGFDLGRKIKIPENIQELKKEFQN
ncbi:hypothetical protein [Paraclostridium tenue]|uniref:Uncharacterized protein n=1 Tax=Paraclostridium tenue TaxID=1737 RepID=A0ABP3XM49_9FIRM